MRSQIFMVSKHDCGILKAIAIVQQVNPQHNYASVGGAPEAYGSLHVCL